uniref:ShKT domain-containing protein n=1 Tax=Parascaris univalens TaxID=6257 RepID=A0A915ACK8_PARUN
MDTVINLCWTPAIEKQIKAHSLGLFENVRIDTFLAGSGKLMDIATENPNYSCRRTAALRAEFAEHRRTTIASDIQRRTRLGKRSSRTNCNV